MEQNISRRNFMKGVGTVALATAASGLLGGCSSDLVADASGLGKTATLSGIEMTVNNVYYESNRTTKKLYIVPNVTIHIQKDAAVQVTVKPVNGNFRILVNGSIETTCDEDAAELILDYVNLTAMEETSLVRGGTAKGCISGSCTRGTAIDYVTVVYYPYTSDSHTYLRCKIPGTSLKPIG